MLRFTRLKLLAGVAILLGLSLGSTGCRSSSSCQCCSPCPDQCCPGGEAIATIGAPTVSAPDAAPAASCNCNSTVASSRPPSSLAASLGRPVAQYNPQPAISRPLWRLASKSHNAPMTAPPGCQHCVPQPQPQQQVAHCNNCLPAPQIQQAAMMLRPVPVGQPLPYDADYPAQVQRISSEAPPLAPPVLQPVSTIEGQHPTVPGLPSGLPPIEQTLVPPPGSVPTLMVQADVTKDDPSKSDKDRNEKDDKDILPPPRLKGGDKKKQDALQPGWPEIPAPMITNPPHAPREFQKHALSAYIIEPPDVLLVESSLSDSRQPIRGAHLVRPDGTIGLGSYGAVFVAGMTIDQAKVQIIEAFMRRGDNDSPFPRWWAATRVDVAAFNSKFYYVITDGGGYGEQVVRLPCTGNETVLDAISQIQGLPAVASKKKIWVARATPHDRNQPIILPVDWYGITQRGSAGTNYQVFPGDRIYVNSDCRIRIDSHLAKIISPIERLFGVTLLGATTVNAIKGNQGGGGGF